MPKAPRENRESPRDYEKVREASRADIAQSKESLGALLWAKVARIEEMGELIQNDGREREQYEVAKNSVDRRAQLLETIMA